MKMFDEIAKKSNFDYTISEPKICCVWGKPDGNGNYTGLLGDMFNKWGDVGWANVWDVRIWGGAWDSADMTYAYLYEKICFMVCQIVNMCKIMKNNEVSSPATQDTTIAPVSSSSTPLLNGSLDFRIGNIYTYNIFWSSLWCILPIIKYFWGPNDIFSVRNASW